MINLNEVESFVTVVDTGSFRAAANKLFKSQPVLTYQIKQLEKYLGVSLFDRSQYRATLSKEGEYFYPRALRLLDQAIAFEALKGPIQEKVELDMSLSISSIYPIDVFSEKLKSVQTQFPDTSFSVSIDTLSGLRKLKEKQVDFAICEDPSNDMDLSEEKCLDTTMIFVCGKGHALSHKNDTDISSHYPQIILKSSGSTPAKDHGVLKDSTRWRVTDINTKKQLIQAGFGWGSLPDHLIQEELQSGALVPIKIPKLKSRVVPLRKVVRNTEKMGSVLRMLWKVF